MKQKPLRSQRSWRLKTTGTSIRTSEWKAFQSHMSKEKRDRLEMQNGDGGKTQEKDLPGWQQPQAAPARFCRTAVYSGAPDHCPRSPSPSPFTRTQSAVAGAATRIAQNAAAGAITPKVEADSMNKRAARFAQHSARKAAGAFGAMVAGGHHWFCD